MKQLTVLRRCNGMVRFGDGHWMPTRREKPGLYLTPEGKEMRVGFEPATFRAMTPKQIVAEMESRGDHYIGHLF